MCSFTSLNLPVYTNEAQGGNVEPNQNQVLSNSWLGTTPRESLMVCYQRGADLAFFKFLFSALWKAGFYPLIPGWLTIYKTFFFAGFQLPSEISSNDSGHYNDSKTRKMPSGKLSHCRWSLSWCAVATYPPFVFFPFMKSRNDICS